MKPLIVTSGEPAGIGPDICLQLAGHPEPLVVLGDKAVLSERAKALNLSVILEDYQPGTVVEPRSQCLTVLHQSCATPVVPGKLDRRNAQYVVKMLADAAAGCQSGAFSGLVTAPVQKSIINVAGIPFTGHTEFLSEYYQTDMVVMLLASPTMKVALVTTHLPLRAVPDAITPRLLESVIMILDAAMRRDFEIPHPKILVAGLNPHAGESGYLGDEEVLIIAPTLKRLSEMGINVHGPLSADTLFMNTDDVDVFLAMYHDQGLPVLKYAGFGQAVNVTLGLPIVRTSVDHGTALTCAGQGLASASSLLYAVTLAAQIVRSRAA